MSKTINTRISQKHDFEVNWNKATGFIPKAGEIIIYDAEVDENGVELTGVRDSSGNLPSNRTEPFTTSRIKVGDGRRNVIALEFTSSAPEIDPDDVFVFYCGDSTELTEDPYN